MRAGPRASERVIHFTRELSGRAGCRAASRAPLNDRIIPGGAHILLLLLLGGIAFLISGRSTSPRLRADVFPQLLPFFLPPPPRPSPPARPPTGDHRSFPPLETLTFRLSPPPSSSPPLSNLSGALGIASRFQLDPEKSSAFGDVRGAARSKPDIRRPRRASRIGSSMASSR